MKPFPTAKDKCRATRYWPSGTEPQSKRWLEVGTEMKTLTLILPIALVWTFLQPNPALPQAPVESGPLSAVLKKMDTAAAGFRTTQAEFEWDVYERVIDEVDDIQKGTIYYRRYGKEIEMM